MESKGNDGIPISASGSTQSQAWAEDFEAFGDRVLGEVWARLKRLEAAEQRAEAAEARLAAVLDTVASLRVIAARPEQVPDVLRKAYLAAADDVERAAAGDDR